LNTFEPDRQPSLRYTQRSTVNINTDIFLFNMPSHKHARQRTISFVTPRPIKLTSSSSSTSLSSSTSITSYGSRRDSDAWDSDESQQSEGDSFPRTPRPMRSEKHPRALKLAGFSQY
jgi:hypothetical protein